MRAFQRSLLLTLFLVCTLGCGNADEEPAKAKQEFRDSPPPPANSVLRVESSTDAVTRKISLVPPKGGGPLVRVLRQGEPVTGEQTFRGRISSPSADVLSLVTDAGEEIQIGFAMPTGIRPRKLDGIPGVLQVSHRSSPITSNTVMTLLAGGKLLIGNIWQVSEKPIQYSPAGGIVLSQRPSPVSGLEQALFPVPVLMNADTLRPGERRQFSAQGIRYTAFIHTSAFRKPADPGDDVVAGYILRAVIVAHDQ